MQFDFRKNVIYIDDLHNIILILGVGIYLDVLLSVAAYRQIEIICLYSFNLKEITRNKWKTKKNQIQ